MMKKKKFPKTIDSFLVTFLLPDHKTYRMASAGSSVETALHIVETLHKEVKAHTFTLIKVDGVTGQLTEKKLSD